MQHNASIKHARKSILFDNIGVWEKTLVYVKMISFEGAEVRELVGLYLYLLIRIILLYIGMMG